MLSATGDRWRDLEPTNIFLCGGDMSQVRILDFGIARRVVHAHAMTRTGMVVGTPEYMAPEQARGSRELLPAADLFSLGCVLYECLTGKPAFIADHVAAVLARILFEEPVPVQARRPGIPDSVVALLARLLVKDPAQRLSSASLLRSELLALGELPEPEPVAAPVTYRPKSESFADDEQSLFSLVLASQDEEATAFAATPPASAMSLSDSDRQSLLQSLVALGAAPDFLVNGTLVVTISALGSAQDQAALAARAALNIKERWPAARVVMATGRGAVREHTAVGEVVELAARLLKTETQPSRSGQTTGVLVDALSAKLLEGRCAQTPQAAGALLLGEEKEADASRPLLGKPTPCVGRETELAMLEAQLADCIENSEARASLFTGPPGSGKSRLRHEFLRRVAQREDAVLVLQGRAELMTAGAPYGIISQALRSFCGLTGVVAAEEQYAQLNLHLGRLIEKGARSRVIEFLGKMCGVSHPDDSSGFASNRNTPRATHDQIRCAFIDWLSAQCRQSAVLLVLDDLQWADSLSIGLIDTALHELRGAPLCVLALARPEVHEVFPKLWPGHNLQDIPLKKLSRKACERLIQQILGRQVAADVVARIIDQASGNALFLEETVRPRQDG